MPRESRFRRLAVHSPARRRLFSGEIDHAELSQRLQSQLDEEVNAQSARWGFNFQAGIPLNSNDNTTTASSSTSAITSSTETFVYESLNANEVPLVYRSHMILRKEIPRIGVVEIKHYPNGRGPMESPTKAAAVESPQKPAERKRHLPTPSTSPMKLRKRASPHKTPVNPGPKHNNEHSSNSAASASKQRPRRNLTEKFKAAATASAVVPSHNSTTSSSEE